MERMQIEKTLREIVSRRLPDVKPQSIDPDAELATLGVDSLAFSWIVADVEDSFDFVMRSADVLKLRTLATAVDYVEKQIGR
jgi:acyl carrier protein